MAICAVTTGKIVVGVSAAAVSRRILPGKAARTWYLIATPAGVTSTREQAAAWRTPLLGMFLYAPPRIFFTQPEQQTLRLALTGAPDAVIAE
jgi:hypothetical protein